MALLLKTHNTSLLPVQLFRAASFTWRYVSFDQSCEGNINKIKLSLKGTVCFQAEISIGDVPPNQPEDALQFYLQNALTSLRLDEACLQADMRRVDLYSSTSGSAAQRKYGHMDGRMLLNTSGR